MVPRGSATVSSSGVGQIRNVFRIRLQKLKAQASDELVQS